MAVDQYVGTCPDCGEARFDLTLVYSRLCAHWEPLCPDEMLPHVATHAVMHTASYQFLSAVSLNGDMIPWPSSLMGMMHAAMMGATGALWQLLCVWPDDPFAVMDEPDGETRVRMVQSQTLCLLDLHEWAAPPPGDRA